MKHDHRIGLPFAPILPKGSGTDFALREIHHERSKPQT